jgi:hypothetical protein
MKTCYICKCEKPLDEFGKDKSRADGKNLACKPCYNAYMRQRLEDKAYREKLNAYQRQWHADAMTDVDYRERAREQGRLIMERRRKDPIRGEQLKAYRRAWLAAKKVSTPGYRQELTRRVREKYVELLQNPAYRQRLNAYSYARHGELKQSTPGWANLKGIEAIYVEMQQRRAAGEDVHVDHIIPRKGKYVSGLHVENNLRIISAAENLFKWRNFELE